MQMRNKWLSFIAAMIIGMLMLPIPAAADDAAELSKKLANPISSLISVPIRSNYDTNMDSSEDGSAWRINIQSVVPITKGR